MIPQTPKRKCDICQMGADKWKNQIMQTCKTCGVSVHETCYGLSPSGSLDPDFNCHACKAVGTTVPVRTRKGPDSIKSLKQDKRPTECALCSVSDGIHSMHPIYDVHGRNGLQYVLPADEKKGLPRRLAWAHSLCAFVLNQNGSLVYACDKKGRFADENGEWRYSDNESDNEDSSEEDEDYPLPTHHFVVCAKKNGEHTVWSHQIEELKRELKCFVCGKKDGKKDTLRFPMQCTAGDATEHFHDAHDELQGSCTVALHVGCARWGNKTDLKHVFFYPGEQPDGVDTPYSDPVADVYCAAHARDVKNYTKSNKQLKETRPKKLDKGPLKKEVPNAPRKNLAYENRLKRKDSGAVGRGRLKKVRQNSSTSGSIGSSSTIVSPSLKGTALSRAIPRQSAKLALRSEEEHAKPLKTSARATSFTSPSNRKRIVGKAQRSSSLPGTNPLDGIEALRFSRKPSVTDKKLKSQKEKVAKKTAARGKNTVASQKKDAANEEWFVMVRDDLLEKTREALKLGKDTIEVGNQCRDLWRGLCEQPQALFREIWREAKSDVQKTIKAERKAAETKKDAGRPDTVPVNPTVARPMDESDDEKPVSRKTSRNSRWTHLSVDDPNFSGDFSFGDWDSCKIVSFT